jgi:hypothetical protein
MNPIPLENGKYYHIYNRGNNGIDLFYETENYNHFLRQVYRPNSRNFCLVFNEKSFSHSSLYQRNK